LDTPVVVGSGLDALREGTARGYDNLLAGLHLRATYIFQPSHQAGVQLALHPLAARRLFGLPARELAEGSHDAADVFCPDLGRLLRVASSGVESRAKMAAAWRWLTANHRRGLFDDLARHVINSPRKHTTVFRDEVGMNPKSVNRLSRFGRARRAIQERVLSG